MMQKLKGSLKTTENHSLSALENFSIFACYSLFGQENSSSIQKSGASTLNRNIS